MDTKPSVSKSCYKPEPPPKKTGLLSCRTVPGDIHSRTNGNKDVTSCRTGEQPAIPKRERSLPVHNWRTNPVSPIHHSSTNKDTRSGVENKPQLASNQTSQNIRSNCTRKSFISTSNQPVEKPLLPPKPKPTSRQRLSHPDLGSSTKNSPVDSYRITPEWSSNTPNSHGTVRAPVAKLEEFETAANSKQPVRPPRSPKNKIFPTGPFSSSKPAIPFKKKSLTLGTDKLGSVTNDFSINLPSFVSKPPKSVEFTVPVVEAKRKSSSLGRYAEPLEVIECEIPEWNIASSGSKSAPVRPPRKYRKEIDPQTGQLVLGRSLCRSISLFSSIKEAEKNIPIYAVVNYNAKRNRRQNTQDKQDISSSVKPVPLKSDIETNTTVEANLSIKSIFLPNTQDNCVNINTSCEYKATDTDSTVVSNIQNLPLKSTCEEQSAIGVSLDTAVCKQDKSSEIDKQQVDNVMGNSEISVTAASQACTVTIRNASVLTQCFSSDKNHSKNLQANNVNLSDLNLLNYASEINTESQSVISNNYNCDQKSISVGSESRVFETETAEYPSVVNEQWESISMECVKDDVKECMQLTEKLNEKWSSTEAIDLSYASSKLEYVSARASLHSSLNDIMHDELAENENTDSRVTESNQKSDKTIVTDKIVSSISTVISFFENVGESDNRDLVTVQSSSTKNKSTRSETNDLTLQINCVSDRQPVEKDRCQSVPYVASRKDEELSKRFVVSGSTERRIHRDQWCDEGELSGVLGDVDSSDAARQSSLDDLNGSDVDDNTPTKRKLLRSFTKNMFRMSGKKSFHKKNSLQSNLSFNNPSHCSESGHINKDSTTDRISTVSAASVLHNLNPLIKENESTARDIKQVQVSEENVTTRTFLYTQIDPHSESENDDESFETCAVDGNLACKLSEEQKQAKKAFLIAQEIMISERVFVDVLKLLSVDFRSFVEAAGRDHKALVIPEKDLSKILNHLPLLLSLNEDLLHDLEQRILSWQILEKISDVIVKKGPFLKLYTSYIQNFENQCTFLDECCQKNSMFAKVVHEFEATPRCKNLSLKHYMLKPVQRVPQYRLLLENYLRCLHTTSPDFNDTQTALQIVCDVADHANRSMKEGDALTKLLKLQSLLGHYELLKPGRFLRREGELLKVCRKGTQPRYFILLNDCLLYTTYYGTSLSGGLKVNYEIPAQQMKVSISSTEDYNNEFSIISTTRSFTLVASSSEEMKEWVNDLEAVIMEKACKESTFHHTKVVVNSSTDAIFKLGEQAPVWIPDRRVTMCQICTTEFTVTFRRHHCRACGKVVCGSCSSNKAPLPYMKFQAARVCNDCFITLHQAFTDNNFLPNDLSVQESVEIIESAKLHFNKALPIVPKKSKKYIPQRLKEVSAKDAGCQMSGWLQQYIRRSWKKMWFVLKDQVLYMYKASEDVVAMDSLSILGYEVTFPDDRNLLYEGIDAKLVFMLTHKGQTLLVFHADGFNSTQRWIKAMQEATTL